MLGMRMRLMGAGDEFVVFVVKVVGEEAVAVIGRVVGGTVAGDVSFAIVGGGERLCLVVVLPGEACLVAERVVGRRDSGCDGCEERSVGIVVGR